MTTPSSVCLPSSLSKSSAMTRRDVLPPAWHLSPYHLSCPSVSAHAYRPHQTSSRSGRKTGCIHEQFLILLRCQDTTAQASLQIQNSFYYAVVGLVIRHILLKHVHAANSTFLNEYLRQINWTLSVVSFGFRQDKNVPAYSEILTSILCKYRIFSSDP